MVTTSEFLERRKAGIGGSDVAALLGLSNWKTPFQLWQEKTGRVDSNIEGSERLHFGQVLEQVVADEFSRRNDLKVERRNNMFVKNEILLANIDRKIVGRKSVLECKTADKFTAHLWGDEDTEQVPEYYLTQVSHYQAVTGYQDPACLAVLIGGNEYRQFWIEYNKDLGEYLAEKCIKWWNDYVKNDTPPPATQNDNLSDYYKYSAGSKITADTDIFNAIEALKIIKPKIKELETQKKELEFEVKDFIGEHELLLGLDGSKLATWKESTSKRINTTALKNDFPEIAFQVMKESKSRRFLLK